ncbi:MAG: amidohydrolase [Lachnospiraceae bacterium]|nr:amidohydrolase [Lachnospiraceae bacterium]
MNEKNRELAIALRHELHRHPELSMEEVWTKQHLMKFLSEHTSLELVDRGRWFYAVYHSSSEKKLSPIAFRADMDALPVEEKEGLCEYVSIYPGRGHKCGHDGHSAALAGFALELDQKGGNRDICLLFQHAEETGQGAKECLSFLKENNISEIFAVHNMPGVSLGAVAAPVGTAQFASTGMTLHFHGQKSHACYPENGKNPSFAIAKLILELENIRESGKYKGMTLITVIEVKVGEHAFGTSAGEGELLLTVRGAFEEELKDLIRHIETFAGQLAEKEKLELTVSFEDEFTDCWNHESSVKKILQAAAALSVPVEEMEEPFRASEDFGRFTKEVPGAIFYIGCGKEHAPIHTPGYDFPDEILPVIVDLYGEIAKIV